MMAALVVGCSDGTQSISGKVSFSDGSALNKGVINLTNDSSSYRSSLGSDGTYTIEGVTAGEYKVFITGAMEGGADTAEIQYDDNGVAIETPEGSEPKPLIHSKFLNPNDSGLTISVPGDYNVQVEKPE